MHFWKSLLAFLGATLVCLIILCAGPSHVHASAQYAGTLTTAPTTTIGTVRQLRVDPITGSIYLLGNSINVFGVLNSDGSSFTTTTYNIALPSHSASDFVVYNSTVYLVTSGIANGLYKYAVSGPTASFITSSTLTSGTPAITFGEDSGSIYASKGTSIKSYDTNLSALTPTITLSSAANRLAYGGGNLFYLSTSGRFSSVVLGASETSIRTGGPTTATVKGLTASDDGSALYYASNGGFGKISVVGGTLLWTISTTNLAAMDVSTSTGKITVINSTGVISTYNPISPISSASISASGTSALLTWDPAILDEDFRGVTIRRSVSSYPTSATDGDAVTSSSMTTSLTDFDLSDGTYYYSFFNQTSDGYFSSAVTSSVVIDLPPSAPTLAAETADDTVSLSWSTPADTATFELRRDTITFPTSHTDGSIVTSTANTVTTLTLSSQPDGTYYYSIFALDLGGNYSLAGTSSVTIDTTPPSSPTLSAIASSSSIILSWDAPATTASFLLRRSASAFPTTILEGLAVTSTVETSFVDTNLDDGTYYYSLFARDSYGNHSTAGTASNTIDTTAPAAASDFSTVASSNNIYLSWVNPADGDLASLILRRSTTSLPSTITDGSAVITTIGMSYTDASLSDNTYYYSLFAIDRTGNTSVRATSLATVNTRPLSSGGGGVGSSSVSPIATSAAPLSFSISNGTQTAAATTVATPVATLKLHANPATMRGYAVSLDSTFTHASLLPLPASGEINVALPEKAGVYTVYLKYFSLSGESSDVITQTITYAPSQKPSSNNSQIAPPVPVFARTLRQGDRGADVKALQVFLNTHGFLVAKIGPGSPNNETTFFGAATTKAVKKFQEANRDTILKPYTLEKGTGIFGARMRELLNSKL